MFEFAQGVLGGIIVGSISNYFLFKKIKEEDERLEKQRKEYETKHKQKIQELREQIDSLKIKLESAEINPFVL